MLDIDLLRTFVAILETGSFTAASDVVRRTQSALSLQMKKLEEQVGHPLLRREPGGIKATAEGERLLIHAKRILRAHEEAILDFSGVSGNAGNLVLGISADYGQALLPRVVRVLARFYPKLSVEVVCGPSRDLYEMCTDGRVEIAFVGEGEGLGQSPVLHRERLVWATGGDVHNKDPLPLALLPAEDSNYRRWALDALDRVGRRHWIAYTCYSLAGLQAIVRAGYAVTVMAESALVTGIRELPDTENFPPLPLLEVRVTRCIAKDSLFLRNLEASLITQLSQDMGNHPTHP
ncbi:LysR family transcriptional regulator [Bradyrhizobium sp.]|uniref:LysR family transcriptional regulator n=1 Tax=Bradyrhizobium sp. TaxID=376 RepID=UPI0025BBC477|nr:LysR family transcriptional regulator [Bradyrhizobium sp.]